jgi:hypothetical protein
VRFGRAAGSGIDDGGGGRVGSPKKELWTSFQGRRRDLGIEEFSGLGLGTLLFFFVLVGLFVVKRAVRKRYFPEEDEGARSEAMAELLRFQAELEGRSGEGESTPVDEVGAEEGETAS